MYDFETAKLKMLENQLLASNLVSYETATKAASIPRELFLPETMKARAYIDDDVQVDDDYSLISLLSLAQLIDIAEITNEDVVLDICSGYGYSTAVLSKFAGMVVGVDKNKKYEEIATKNFADLSLDNAVLITKDEPEQGLKKQAPYNLILIAGVVEKVPEHLFDQLANGGRLVTVCLKTSKKYGTGSSYYGEITKVIRKGRAFDKKVYSDILLFKQNLFYKK